jgi:hypothetical protein
MSSTDKIKETKEKLNSWKVNKEKELLRQVVILKKLTARENNITASFTNSVYTDIVNDVDKLRGS